MRRPISPNDLPPQAIPDEVIEAFDYLIRENWIGKEAKVYQKDILRILVDKLQIESSEILDRRLLDVESLYEAVGWQVEYHKPMYDENFDAYFLFTVA